MKEKPLCNNYLEFNWKWLESLPITVNVQKYEIYHEMYQTFSIQANLDAINQLLVIFTNYHDILLKTTVCGHRNSLGTTGNAIKQM